MCRPSASLSALNEFQWSAIVLQSSVFSGRRRFRMTALRDDVRMAREVVLPNASVCDSWRCCAKFLDQVGTF
jgi:hypothetical protein